MNNNNSIEILTSYNYIVNMGSIYYLNNSLTKMTSKESNVSILRYKGWKILVLRRINIKYKFAVFIKNSTPIYCIIIEIFFENYTFFYKITQIKTNLHKTILISSSLA